MINTFMIEGGKKYPHHRKAEHSPKCKVLWLSPTTSIHLVSSFCCIQKTPSLASTQPTQVCHKITHHLSFLLQACHTLVSSAVLPSTSAVFSPLGSGWEMTVSQRSLAQNIHAKQNSIGSGANSAKGRKANRRECRPCC